MGVDKTGGVDNTGGAKPLSGSAFQQRVASEEERLKQNSVFKEVLYANPNAAKNIETTAFLHAVYDANGDHYVERNELDAVSCPELEERVNEYEPHGELSIPSCQKLNAEFAFQIDEDKNITPKQREKIGFAPALDTAQALEQQN